MSKNHRQNRKPDLTDWTIRYRDSLLSELVRAARMRRDDRGGYTFTDDRGTVADFPPQTVLNVTRLDPEPVLDGLFAAPPEVLDSRA